MRNVLIIKILLLFHLCGNAQFNLNYNTQYTRSIENDQKIVRDNKGKIYILAEGILELNENTTALDLSEQDLSEVPDVVFKYTQLNLLWLEGNHIMSMDSRFKNLINLKYLNFSNNELFDLALEGLTKLEDLDISKNNLKHLTFNIDTQNTLFRIDASNCNIKVIDSTIVNLQKIETLILAQNELEEISSSFGKLRLLKILNASHNHISLINNDIGNCSSLEGLTLRNNNIGNLPETIGNLSNLVILDIGFNKINQLPKSLVNIKKLLGINAEYNQLQSAIKILNQLPLLLHFDYENNLIPTNELEQIKNKYRKCKSCILPRIWTLKADLDLNLSENYLKNVKKQIDNLEKIVTKLH